MAMAWEDEAIEDATEVDSAGNGGARGDGYDATLYRLGPHGRTYAPGGTEYMVLYSRVGGACEYWWAWADTEEEGRQMLRWPPSAAGWQEGEGDDE